MELTKSAEKQCPFCAETIKAAAIKCRFCQSDLSGSAASHPPPSSGDLATEGPESEETVTEEPALEEPARERDATEEPPAPASSWAAPGRSAKASFLASGRLSVVLVVLCLLLTGLVGYAWYDLENSETGPSTGAVITSSQARDAGMAAATELTQKVLAYDWKTLDADMSAAEKVMAPTFRAEYTKAMGGVKAQTVENQVKLVANVVATSVISASKTKVQALVFVNQVTTAKGSANQRLDQNRVRVTLTRGGGDWRVSKMDAF